MFGCADINSNIENIGLENIEISGNGYNHISGIIAYNLGTIKNCYTTGNILGDSTIGGIVASNLGTITNCYNIATVMDNGHMAGGIVGWNQGILTHCYNMGNISANGTYAGGIAGYNYYNSENEGIITNCYNTGNVTGTGNLGRIVGYNTGTGVTNCFFDSTILPTLSAIGGGTTDGCTVFGKTTTEMQTQSTYTDAGWDFVGEITNGTDDIWTINSSYNNGYPILRWQL